MNFINNIQISQKAKTSKWSRINVHRRRDIIDTRMGTTYMYDKDANLTTPLPEKVKKDKNIN